MTAPRVSVVMSVYNDEPFLREAIDSILAQTFRDFEFIIINDGSSDASPAILASYSDPRIRVIHNEQNIGLTKSLNRGLREARGELIARFDANDASLPERFGKQVAFLDAHPEVAVAGVQMMVIDVAGRRLRRAESRRPMTDTGVAWWQMFTAPLGHPASMFRRRVVLEELGGYDEEFRTGQDAELWFRVVERGYRITTLPERLLALRFDRRSISGNPFGAVRAGHHERWIPLSHRAMRRALQMDVPVEWPETWAALCYSRDGSAVDAGRRFPAVLDAIYRRFIEVHPDGAGSPDVEPWRAAMLGVAAVAAAPRHRLQSARTLLRAMAADPSRAVVRFAGWARAAVRG